MMVLAFLAGVAVGAALVVAVVGWVFFAPMGRQGAGAAWANQSGPVTVPTHGRADGLRRAGQIAGCRLTGEASRSSWRP